VEKFTEPGGGAETVRQVPGVYGCLNRKLLVGGS
jgi:hypothetical protein